MRYCGVDVSARPSNQQLVTLHERRTRDGVELVATFYAPGTVDAVARTVEGFGRGEAVVGVDAPSGHRLDLLAPGSPARSRLRLARGALRAHARVRRAAVPPRPAAVPRAAGLLRRLPGDFHAHFDASAFGAVVPGRRRPCRRCSAWRCSWPR